MSFKTGTCSKCGARLDGAHNSYCKACMAAYARENRTRHPGRGYAHNKTWQRHNADKWKQIQKANKLKAYGLSLHDYNRLLEDQNHLCAICRGDLQPFPYVDHNHETDEVRGILCGPCNIGLGHIHDNPEIADAMAAYLRNPPARPRTRAKQLDLLSEYSESNQEG